MADLYEELGVPKDADAATLKAAKRRVAREHHPDKPGGDEETFKRKMRAVAILSDPDARAHYDRTGDEGTGRSKHENPIFPLLVQAFDHALVEAMSFAGVERFDIVKAMREFLLGKAAEGEAHNEKVKEATATLEKVRARLSFSGDGEDMLAATIRSRLAHNEQALATNSERVESYRAAAGYAKAWEYRVDPAPARPTYGGSPSFEDLMADSVREAMRQRGGFAIFREPPFRNSDP